MVEHTKAEFIVILGFINCIAVRASLKSLKD